MAKIKYLVCLAAETEDPSEEGQTYTNWLVFTFVSEQAAQNQLEDMMSDGEYHTGYLARVISEAEYEDEDDDE